MSELELFWMCSPWDNTDPTCHPCHQENNLSWACKVIERAFKAWIQGVDSSWMNQSFLYLDTAVIHSFHVRNLLHTGECQHQLSKHSTVFASPWGMCLQAHGSSLFSTQSNPLMSSKRGLSILRGKLLGSAHDQWTKSYDGSCSHLFSFVQGWEEQEGRRELVWVFNTL